MGMIQLFNGDCIEVMKDMPDNSIDLIVTDPPYKVTARGVAGNSGGMLQKKINKKGLVFAENNIEIEQWLPILYKK
jgi:site-specific DNA-methyltransferase (adenine-specific)